MVLKYLKRSGMSFWPGIWADADTVERAAACIYTILLTVVGAVSIYPLILLLFATNAMNLSIVTSVIISLCCSVLFIWTVRYFCVRPQRHTRITVEARREMQGRYPKVPTRWYPEEFPQSWCVIFGHERSPYDQDSTSPDCWYVIGRRWYKEESFE